MTNKEFFIHTWKVEMPLTSGAIKALTKDMDKLNYRCKEQTPSASQLTGDTLLVLR